MKAYDKDIDSTTKKWASKPKTAKSEDLGSGSAAKAAKSVKDRNAKMKKMLDEI